MSHRLSRLSIQGFKSIENLDIELTDLTIIVGANGSGKSNLVQFFDFINKLAQERLQAYVAAQGGFDRLLFFGSKQTKEMWLKVTFGSNAYSTCLKPTTDDNCFFDCEQAYFLGNEDTKPYSIDLNGAKETGLNKSTQRVVTDHVRPSLLSWKTYQFHDTSVTARVKKQHPLHDNDRLQPDAGNLAPFLYRLQTEYPQQYQRIVRAIQWVAPYFAGFHLVPTGREGDERILLRWKHQQNDDYVFTASDLSDGTLRYCCLATLLLQPKELCPTLMVLDKPELGLHPFALKYLAELIQSASHNTQLLLATQSVTLLNQFHIKDVLVVEQESSGASVFKRLDPALFQDDWMNEYGLGDLWERNWIGGTP